MCFLPAQFLKTAAAFLWILDLCRIHFPIHTSLLHFFFLLKENHFNVVHCKSWIKLLLLLLKEKISNTGKRFFKYFFFFNGFYLFIFDATAFKHKPCMTNIYTVISLPTVDTIIKQRLTEDEWKKWLIQVLPPAGSTNASTW